VYRFWVNDSSILHLFAAIQQSAVVYVSMVQARAVWVSDIGNVDIKNDDLM